MTVRGYEWAVYVTDTGFQFALRVDADSIEDPCRGWSTAGVEGMVPLPRQWAPRVVVGQEPSGRTHLARVASVDAPLWTGICTDFTVQTNDQETVLCRVIQRRQERRLGPA